MLLERTKAILAELIAFPTVSSESNLALIEHAGALLREAGADVRVLADGSGRKANLFATLGPGLENGVVLSGHSDVVPVEGQDWTSDPFTMREDAGLLYGRGACDMKGFIAACLAMAPVFAERNLTRPLHFAFTYDEEVGCLGARALVKDLAALGIRPSAVIIGEPTDMRIIEGHKGCFEYTTRFTGSGGHASQPDAGVNAIEFAMRYLERLLSLREPLKARAPAGSRFEPPWTTLQAGAISGGPARNVVASECLIDWEMRPVTASDADFVKADIAGYVDDVLRPAMHRIDPTCEIVTHVVGEVEGLEPVDTCEALRIARALTGRNETDVVSFGTEAGLFQTAGISAVVCGPGSIAQAHKPDEFISIDQLDQCLGMLRRLADRLSVP